MCSRSPLSLVLVIGVLQFCTEGSHAQEADGAPPTPVSITRHSPREEVTDADQLAFELTFSGPVSNLDTSDFEVSGTTAQIGLEQGDLEQREADVAARQAELTELNAELEYLVRRDERIAEIDSDVEVLVFERNKAFREMNTAINLGVFEFLRALTVALHSQILELQEEKEYLLTIDSDDVDDARALVTAKEAEVADAQAMVDSLNTIFRVTLSGGDLADLHGTVTLTIADGNDLTDSDGTPLASTVPSDINENTFQLQAYMPPVFTASGPYSVDENATGTVGDVNAHDGDGGGTDAGLTYSITAGNTSPDGDGDPAFAINATTGVISVNDTGDLDFETTPGFSLTVQVDVGGAGNNTSTTTVTINVNNLNEDPSATGIPTGIFAIEDVASTMDLSSITISDPDADASDIALVIQASAGTLVAAGGGSVTVGGSGTSELVLTGALADINTFLDTAGNITYTGAASAHGQGAATLSLTANDGGHSGSGGGNDVALGTVIIDIDPVADTPSVTDATTDEDVQTSDGLVTSRNAADGSEVTHFKITSIAGGQLYKNDGTTRISAGDFITYAEGSAGLRFTPATDRTAAGSFDVQASTSDDDAGLGGDVVTATITISAVNDAPAVLTGDPAPALLEDATFTFSGGDAVSVSDSDAAGADMALTVTATSKFTATASGTADITGNGTNSVSIVGSESEINAALDGSVFTPAQDQTTEAWVTFDLDDLGNTGAGGNRTASETVTFTITPVNDPPGISGDLTLSVDEGRSVLLTTTDLDGTDPDDDGADLTYSVGSGPSQGTIQVSGSDAASFTQADLDAGLVTYVHDGSETLTDVFVLSLADGGEDGAVAATATMNVAIATTNDPPTVTTIADQSIDEDADTGALAITIGDEESAAGALVVTATASNEILFPDASLSLGGSGANRTITAAPAAHEHGSAVITVTVDDGTDVTEESFTMTVNPVNDEPSFSAPDPPAVNEDAGAQSVVGWATFNPGTPEESGQAVDAFSVSNITNEALFATAPTVDANGTLTYTPAANASGTSEFTVRVTDDGGTLDGGSDTSASQTFSITVNAVNDAPVVTSASSVGILEGQTGVLTVTFDDPDAGDSHAFSISGGADANAFSIDAASGVLAFAAPPDFDNPSDANADNDYSVQVTVTDNWAGALTGVQDILVTVTNVNEAPAISSASSASVAEGTTAIMTVTAADPDGDGLQYSLLGGADVALFSVDQNTGELTFLSAPDFEQPADANGDNVYHVSVMVTDDGADTLTDAMAITVTVTDENEAPSIRAIVDQNIAEDTATDAIAFTVADIDSPVGTLVVTASSSDQSLIPDANLVLGGADGDRTITVAPAANAHGTATITVTVSDGSLTADTTFDVEVTSVNDAATISAIADQTVPEGTATGALAFTVADMDSPVGTLVVTASPSDQALIPDANLVLGGADGDRTITVAPAANANGTATITVTVSDGDLAAETTFEVEVTPVNDAPTISAIADQTVPEGTAAGALAFTVADIDTPVGTLVVSASSSDQALIPDANLVLGGADGDRTITVTPAANAHGTATITVTVSDGDLAAETTFEVTVASVNNAPSFTAGADVTVDEDAGAQSVPTWATNISAGPPNEAGQNVTFQVTNSNATLFAVEPAMDATSGELTFTPADNAFGEATVTVVLIDDGGTANGGTDSHTPEVFTITLTPVNDAPVATDDVAETSESSPVVIAVLANDVDVDSEFTLADVTEPTHGQVALNDDGTVTYSPDAGYFGEDAFTYAITDGELTASATVTVTIQSTNGAPTPANDVVTVFQGESASFNVLANDSDPDGDAIEARLLSAASLGSATLAANGEFTYTAHATAEGTDVLTYEAIDPEGQATAATITVTVSGPGTDGDGIDEGVETRAPNHGDGNNDGMPDAEQQNVASLPIVAGRNAGQYVTVAAPAGTRLDRVASTHNPAPESFPDDVEIPAGFVDFTVQDMDVGHSTVVEITLPPTAIVVGYLKYGPTPENPEPHWYEFDYDGVTGAIIEPGRILLHLTDGLRGDDDLTANGIIRDPGTPVFKSNGLPVPMADAATLDEDMTVFVDVLTNDADPEGAPLTVTAVGAPTNGVTAIENGRIRYTPNPDFFGEDAFVYTVSDGVTSGVQATVTVTVTGTQDAPVAVGDAAETVENTPVTIDIFANDFDVDGDALFLTSQGLPQHGRAVYNDDGTVTYTPAPGFSGVDHWNYTISDGPDASGETIFGRITVTVTAVQKAPVGQPDEIEGLEDERILFNPLENDSDPDGDAITLVSVTQPLENGSVAIKDGGLIAVIPHEDFSGVVTFSYTISDGERLSDPIPVTVTVLPFNDAPVFPADGVIEESLDATILLVEPVMVRFREAYDIDDTRLTYRWELATTAAFPSVARRVEVTTLTQDESGLAVFTASADTLAEALLLEPGADVTLFQRMVAVDGSGAETASAAQQVTFFRPASVANGVTAELPTEVYLSGNYPNPFNPSTTVEFGLPTAGRVRLELYDLQGRLARVVVQRTMEAGHHRVRLELSGLASGVYIYRLIADGNVITRTMQMVK